MLEINNLHAELADGSKQILHGVDLSVAPGEIHAFMGPNCSGKSTLTHAIMGNPKYRITEGTISIDGHNIESLPTFERARAGLFATMQYPVEIPGVPVEALLATVYGDVSQRVKEEAKLLEIENSFLERGVNDEFSGGERKRMETLQLTVSNAKYSILDEIDSGLDVDALRAIATRINNIVATKSLGVIAITHYDRLLTYLNPTHVHIFANGKIIQSGGIELARDLEASGYESFISS